MLAAARGIPQDIPLEFWCEQYQQAFEAKLSYDAVLLDIINQKTLRSFEQAMPNSAHHSGANLYQLVGHAVNSLNQHETSDRRDLKQSSQRTAGGTYTRGVLGKLPVGVFQKITRGGVSEK